MQPAGRTEAIPQLMPAAIGGAPSRRHLCRERNTSLVWSQPTETFWNCGVIGEAENEVSGGTCLVCLEFHRGSKGVWQITRPVLFFPSDGFHGLARQIVEALGQRRGAADSRAQLASDR